MSKEWYVEIWPAKGAAVERIVIMSNNFDHDAALVLSGDFATRDDKIAFADELAEKLNR
jgi:hypothetical protein